MKRKKLFGVALLALLFGVVLGGFTETVRDAIAQFNTANYLEQGGSRTVIGGSLDVASGGDLDIESGGAFKIAGTTVTSTAAELNGLDGVTATAAELNASSDQSGWAALDPGADDALTLVEHGAYPSKAILLSSADGDTFTLPAASGSGAVYTVVVSTTVTSNNHIIQVANATDEFYGTVFLVDTSDDSVDMFPCLDADGFDTITCNGGTKCGIKGDTFKFTDIAAGQWQLEAVATCTGTCATMLSAGV